METTKKLHPTRKQLADSIRNIWCVTPEEGVAFKDVLAPEFWAHVAKDLRPTDRIEVYAEDGSYFAELMVRSTGKVSANVVEMRKVDFDKKEPETSSDTHHVKWKGPHHKWAVVRKSDGATVQTGYSNKEDAYAWLSSNLKSLND